MHKCPIDCTCVFRAQELALSFLNLLFSRLLSCNCFRVLLCYVPVICVQSKFGILQLAVRVKPVMAAVRHGTIDEFQTSVKDWVLYTQHLELYSTVNGVATDAAEQSYSPSNLSAHMKLGAQSVRC